MIWVILMFVSGICWGAGTTASPVVTHPDPATQREFQNSYQAINSKPSIYSGAGAPTYAPSKVGDIYISTTTSKVYMSTSTVSAGSWTVLN